MIRLGTRLLALGILIAVSVAAFAEPVRYEFIDIGTMGSPEIGIGVDALAINNRGQVAGTIRASGTAFLWEAGVTMTLSTGAAAYDINDLGQVAGVVGGRSVIWDNGQVVDLGSLREPGQSFVRERASAINNAGQVVGESCGPDLRVSSCGFLWQAGSMKDIRSGDFYLEVVTPTDINDTGQIAGIGSFRRDEAPGPLVQTPFIWEAGHYRFLSIGDFDTAGIAAINDTGDAVGSAGLFRPRAVLWAGNAILDLGVWGTQSRAQAINNDRQVVGFYVEGDRAGGFLWEDGVLRDLRGLIDSPDQWQSLIAFDINDAGWIVGAGSRADNEIHAFILRPMPEPGSWPLLLLAGMICVPMMRPTRTSRQRRRFHPAVIAAIHAPPR